MATEFSDIEKFLRPLADTQGASLLLDDGAHLNFSNSERVSVTTDMLVEDLHFLKNGDPLDIAYKVLGCNLSDVAAMGAYPKYYTLSIARPDWANSEWLARFSDGLSRLQKQYGLFLIGGDTVGGDRLVINVTMFATAPLAQQNPLRSEARIEDEVWMTGTAGDGALGLDVLQGRYSQLDADTASYLKMRYWRPQPRLISDFLGRFRCACADVSDGVLADIRQICKASQVGAHICLEDVPLSTAFKATQGDSLSARLYAASGGDDYELLLCGKASDMEELALLCQEKALSLTKIGTITSEAGCIAVTYKGKSVSVQKYGWEHL